MSISTISLKSVSKALTNVSNEYIEIFYNRQRSHASNGYLTPEEFYNRTSKQANAA